MSLYQQLSTSSIKTEELQLSLPGVSLKQSNILFDGGYSLSFANILSGTVDVQPKNYSNFYLSTVEQFDNVVDTIVSDIKPSKLVTTLQTGQNFIAYPISTPVFDRYSTQLEIGFDAISAVTVKSQFIINFVSSKYCTVGWDDGISVSYIVLDNGLCKLKRAPLISGTEHYFNYILNGSKLVLLKTISNNTFILTNNTGKLSAVNYQNFPYRNLQINSFTVDNKVEVELPSSVDQQYIDYTNSGLDISTENRVDNIKHNFLVSRNHTSDSLYDVILLKNHFNESGDVGLYNTLGLSGNDASINYRNYTSINSNIDQVEDNSLSLSYVCYNQSFSIQPGLNTFTTSDTMFPFSVLNINDTTFINNGSFGSITPKYSDKVYYQTTNNIGENTVYLCTWLSHDPVTQQSVWLDRYYYPNLTTKEDTLTAAIYNSTFDSYIEQLIASNQGLSQSVSANQYFDKISDFAFRPNETYVYDRIDINNIDFFTTKNNIDAEKGYFSQINNNGGFTLSFYINQYTSAEFVSINSKFNDIGGGVFVQYNNEQLFISFTLYDSVVDEYRTITSGAITLPTRTKNSIVCHYDSGLGIIKAYLNEDLVVDSVIEPFQYNIIVYGDFAVQGDPLNSANNYISDTFLSLSPISQEELTLLVAKYNIIYNTFSISLPCGMRNRVDSVKHINILDSNGLSKSNTVDIFLDGLEVSDSDKELLKTAIKAELVNNLPLNTTINNIEFL
jgi:hypothetical protein